MQSKKKDSSQKNDGKDLSLTPTQKLIDDNESDSDNNEIEILSPHALTIKLQEKDKKVKIPIFKKFYPPEIINMKIPNATWSIDQLKFFVNKYKLNINDNLTETQLLEAVLNKIDI